MASFHEQLRRLCTLSGKTQAAIAAKLKITPQAFSYYIYGREPNYDLLRRIANYFNVTTDFLLDMPDTNTRIVEVDKGLASYSSAELLKEVERRMKGE